MDQAERIQVFVRGIWDWFRTHKRSLPWRDLRVRDPNHRAYLILVSEIMLQQTQVSRVIHLYKNFIQTYPRIEDLSRASNSEVIIAWRGLGYNNRALRLRNTAREIVEKRSSVFPQSLDELLLLPGIGHYTASAVRNFAFQLPTPCIDTNIRRILHRFFFGIERGDGTWKKQDKDLLLLAKKVLEEALKEPCSTTADWHAALMDFGALVCTKNNPKWHHFSKDLKLSCISYGKELKRTKKLINNEPGRLIAGVHVPNRIIRGRIVEVLRGSPRGIAISDIGPLVAIDWVFDNHTEWLTAILQSLERDGVVKRTGDNVRLSES